MNLFDTEPVAVQAAIFAIVNMLVVLGVLHLTDLQLGGVNTAIAAVLGLIIRRKVTPV